jgi:hypothetical protein
MQLDDASDRQAGARAGAISESLLGFKPHFGFEPHVWPLEIVIKYLRSKFHSAQLDQNGINAVL